MKRKMIALILVLALMLSLSVTALAAGTAFVDVRKTDPYYTAVQWAEQEKVTAGVDATHFAPDGKATRAQAVTFLWNMAGRVDPVRSGTFSDVKKGSWYEKAVEWAAENDIVAGTGNGQFSPNALCTRAQIITMLYKMSGLDYAAYMAHEPVTISEDSTAEEWSIYMLQQYVNMIRSNDVLSDVPAGSYYELPVVWSLMNGVSNANNTPTDGLFHSQDACTRGEMISFIYQYHLYEDALNNIYPSEKIEETTLLDTDQVTVTAKEMKREGGTTPVIALNIVNKTSKKIVVTPTVKANSYEVESDLILIERNEETRVTVYPVVETIDAGAGVDCYLRIYDSSLEENAITDIGVLKIQLTVTDYDTEDVLAEGQEVILKTDKYYDVYPLKENPEEAEYEIKAAMQNLLKELYGDKVYDARINVTKIYSAREEQQEAPLKAKNLDVNEVAFEVTLDLLPATAADVNVLRIPNGTYDEASGWVVNRRHVGILRPNTDSEPAFIVTDFGTSF